jgi:ribosomal protein S18 acetylase RimI-like enzyme
VEKLLDNPVYHALLSGDSEKGFGSEHVRYFDKEISPFAGFPEQYENGFNDLYNLLPDERRILYATRNQSIQPKCWKLIQHIHGSQFLFSSKNMFNNGYSGIMPLEKQHVEQMVALAALTKPGPFDKRTIEFSNYHGIFEGKKLVAMTGQRLHVYDYTEISAVCTHPDYLGRGYAAALLKHQTDLILADQKTPFLHVRSDNERAIAVYERLGFKMNGPMNFYFLEKA